ncbi:MAG: J domain-containing protein [Planctomycetota bacterium]|nr:J domain-containing protein [Planctomycetota bacterium]
MTITEALQLLELMPPFTAAHAKKAFREAHLVWHPDRFPTNPELHAKAHARTCLINDAFDVISRALQAG